MMNAERIIREAEALGVLLYLGDGGKLSYVGELPRDWAKVTAEWLPHRDELIAWLKNAPMEHRAKVAKAMAQAAKRAGKTPCQHLGRLIDPKPSCGCGGKYFCELFQSECVLNGKYQTLRSCSSCPNYQAKEDAP